MSIKIENASKLPELLDYYSKHPANISAIPTPPCIDPIFSNLDPPQGDTTNGYRWTALNKNGGLIIHDLDEKAFMEFAAQCIPSNPVSRAFAACVVVRINSPENFLQDLFAPLLSHEIRHFESYKLFSPCICRIFEALVYLTYVCIRMSIILLGDIATLPIRLLTLIFRISTLMEIEKDPLQKKYNLPDHAELHFLAWRVSLIPNQINIIGNQKISHYCRVETKVQAGYCLDFVSTPAHKNDGHYFQVTTRRTENASIKTENLPPPPPPPKPAVPPTNSFINLQNLQKMLNDLKQKVENLNTSKPAKPPNEYPPFFKPAAAEPVGGVPPPKPASAKPPKSEKKSSGSSGFQYKFKPKPSSSSHKHGTYGTSKPKSYKAPKTSFIDDRTPAALAFMGLAKDCTKADVKAEYKKMALKCHPDKFPEKQQTGSCWSIIMIG